MNAPPQNQHRQAFPVADLADEKMTQVRELLIGDYVRANEARIAAMESRVRDLELDLSQRLMALHQRIDALAAGEQAGRRAAFEELGRSVGDLSDRIRLLAR